MYNCVPRWLDVCGDVLIFAYFPSAPWLEGLSPEEVLSRTSAMNAEFYYNYVGSRYASPLVVHLLGDNDSLDSTAYNKIAAVINTMYADKWRRQWDTLTFEYDPISNYDMTEIMTDDETVTEYGKSNTRTDNLTNLRTPNTTETITPSNLTTTTNNSLYGFNSSAPVPSSGQTQTASGSTSTTRTGSETTTNTGTQTDAESGSDTSTRNYTLTRTGNIGVTTSQQMIESERNLWMWDYFYKVVFPDICRVITIPIY